MIDKFNIVLEKLEKIKKLNELKQSIDNQPIREKIKIIYGQDKFIMDEYNINKLSEAVVINGYNMLNGKFPYK